MPGLLSSHLVHDSMAILQMQQTPDEQTGYLWMFVIMAATPY